MGRMTDAEAIEELAKALDHISKSKELAETDICRTEIENLEDMYWDVIDGIIESMATH